MTATFCGHAQISRSADVEKWLYAVTLHLIEQGVNIFYLGGYGAFDSLAAAVLRKQKIQHPEIELILVLAYFDTKRDISGYDSKFLQRTIEIQQQMEALRQSKAQIASEDYNPGRLDMEAIEAALCEAVEIHDGLVSEDFIDLFVSQVTPLSDSRFAWCLDFSPQPTVAFLNLAGQRKYTTCSMDSKLHFGPFADEEGHTIPFPGSLRR